MYINLKIFDKVMIKSELCLNVEGCKSVFIEIEIEKNDSKTTNILLGCIYRHPRWVTTPFIDQLCKKLNFYIEKDIPLVLVGDFNIDLLENDKDKKNISLCNRGRNFVNILSSMGCKSLVNVPTCFTDESRSCLDHVVTNIHEDHIQYGVLDETCTNHLPTYAIVSGLVNQGDAPDPTENEEV